MTKALDVAQALKALAQTALPSASVRGFDGDSARPDRITAGGCVIGAKSDPGSPDVDLSPLTYNYRHQFDLEFAAADGVGGEPLDAMLRAFGAAIIADRTLGGLCTWLEAEAPVFEDAGDATVPSINWASVAVMAEYSTTNPLG